MQSDKNEQIIQRFDQIICDKAGKTRVQDLEQRFDSIEQEFRQTLSKNLI